MNIHLETIGYYFNEKGIAKIEENYNAKYMGFWTIRTKSNSWSDDPVDVFYVANPDRSKGHSNYFGMFTRNGEVFITNAESAFEQSFIGIAEGGEVYCSHYRHDYVVTPNGYSIDGGRDYLNTSLPSVPARDKVEIAEKKLSNTSRFVSVSVRNGEFEFSELIDKNEPNKSI